MRDTGRVSSLLLLPICLWAGLPGQVANAASAVETTGAGDASHCHSPDAFDWLLGSWESREGESVVRERWHRVSQDTLEGIGETLKGGKPIVSESLRLVQMSDGIFYIAKVNHNPLPVAFALTDCDAQGVSFENPEHDFPKRIDYRRLAKDQILVTVGDGKQKGFSIRFVRDSAEH